MAALVPQSRQRFTDGNGAPLVGGSVAFCTPGTAGTQFRPIFADEDETIPLQNPVPLDSSGTPYSGGSQVTVWGFGRYEQFVRDADRNLIYSGLLDTGASSSNLGGTVNGSLQINGDLSVIGNITDTKSLTTPSISGTNGNFGGTVGINILNTTHHNTIDLTASSDIISHGSGHFDGNLGVVGIFQAGASAVTSLAVTGHLAADSAAITSLATTNFFVKGEPLPLVQAGSVITNGVGINYIVNFPTAYSAIKSVMLTADCGKNGTTPFANPPSVLAVSTTQLIISVPDEVSGSPDIHTVYWTVLGS